MNRVRRLATELINQFPDKFTSDYEANKKVLTELAIFRSKSLRNEIAGYITRYFKLKEEEKKEGEEKKEQVEVKGAAPAS
ncbi:MAG: 30S ribosomal protein S17e [Conexivisphaerales archaeon]